MTGILTARTHRLVAAALLLSGCLGGGAGGSSPARGPATVSAEGTGTLTCILDEVPRYCDYAVIRRGGGDAKLYLDLPGNRDRRIDFLDGRPVGTNAPAEITRQRTRDGQIVGIGAAERFVVADAILYGR